MPRASHPQGSTADDAVDATILLTGVGAPGTAGFLGGLDRSALDTTVVAVGARERATGVARPDRSYAIPHATADGYLDGVREVVAREAVDVIVPSTADDLRPLAAAKREFAARGVTVAVADPEPLSVAVDGARLYEFLEARRFAAVPDYERVDDRQSFVEAVERLGYPHRPVRIASAVGGDARGVCHTDQPVGRFELLVGEPPENGVASLRDVLDVLDGASAFPELVAASHPPGPAYGVDVVATDEAVPAVVPRTRERTRAGVSLAATVERNEGLVGLSRAIVSAVGLEYCATLRFRDDGDGRPTLLGIDPCVSEATALCVGAGANLPALAVRHALGLPVTEPDVAWGTSMRRFREDRLESSTGRARRLSE